MGYIKHLNPDGTVTIEVGDGPNAVYDAVYEVFAQGNSCLERYDCGINLYGVPLEQWVGNIWPARYNQPCRFCGEPWSPSARGLCDHCGGPPLGWDVRRAVD